MTVRKMPPGRRSSSQPVVVHGAGVNHFFRCSGLVHAAHTSSLGTLTTRSIARSSAGFIRVVIVLVISAPSDQLGKRPIDPDGGSRCRAAAGASFRPFLEDAVLVDK